MGLTPAFASEALWIDVDHRAEVGSAHCGGGGAQEAARLRGQAAGLVGLRYELRAELAAQAQKRRGAEQVAVEAGFQLRQRAQRRVRLGAGDDDADEVAERRIAERAATLELAGEETRHVVASRQLD